MILYQLPGLVGFVFCVTFVFMMIWSSGKSVMTRVLYSVTIFLIPVAILCVGLVHLSHAKQIYIYGKTMLTLRRCLQEDEKNIPDQKISEILRNKQDPSKYHQALSNLPYVLPYLDDDKPQ